jgi:hypothetical protein
MLSKSLLVSLALAAASVHADLYISTPSELKQVSVLKFLVSLSIALARRTPVRPLA